MDLSAYKQIKYKELQRELSKKRDEVNKHELSLAADINVKSVATVRNVFNSTEQITSDEILTKLFKALGLKAMVGWIDGERRYFISE